MNKYLNQMQDLVNSLHSFTGSECPTMTTTQDPLATNFASKSSGLGSLFKFSRFKQ